MEELLSLAAIIFITVLAPLFIVLNFVTKWKQSREISGDDEQMLEDLWSLSQRLEDRIDALESILEDDTDWRKKE